MNNEKLNCCNSENSDCNTQETNCCIEEKQSTSNKKKAGLGILLLAIVFAVFSAFTTGNSNETASCTSGEASCEVSCETGSEKNKCCSK